MFDAQRLLGQVLGEALGGNLGRKRRQRGPLGLLGSSLGIGRAQVGLGLLGLAFAAFEHYSQQPPPVAASANSGPGPMPPPPPPRSPAAGAIDDSRALHLLRAMIAAAHADGAIDAGERSALLERARAAGVASEDLATLDVEMRAPMTLEQLAARTPADLREDTWAAALVAATPDTEAEQRFLAGLGDALGIDATRRRQIAQLAGSG